ncbi:MAG: hypothetical protein P4L75_07640 [Clostridia bacterium]|nr:hypothetical protein [Clostridia bacterium]MDR3644570.1 hypothetical protein [Clostridia bacterium]
MKVKRICCVALVCALVAVSVPICSAASPKTSSNLSAIVASLKKDKNVKQYTVSRDSKEVAVVKEVATDKARLYVIIVSSKKQNATNVTGMLYDPKWSYNDQYISVEDGTAVLHKTHIVTASTFRRHLTVVDTGMVWAYKSNVIAFAVVNKIKPAKDIELNGTTDIIVYNMSTLKYRRVLKATSEILYTPVKWDKNGLWVDKSFLNGKKSVTVKLNISK